MQNLGALNILRLPLQVLWEFPDIKTKIEENRLALESDFLRWYEKYDIATQDALLAQLHWAVIHPAYDFIGVLKNVRTSNEDIIFYFHFLERLFTKYHTL